MGIIRYKPSGKYTLRTMIILNVRRCLFDLINNCKGFNLVACDVFDKELEVILEDYPIEEHPQTDLLVNALRSLTEQEQQVLEHRYGLEGSYPKSVMETSRMLKVGHCVVTRSEKRGIDRIRQFMEANHATS